MVVCATAGNSLFFLDVLLRPSGLHADLRAREEKLQEKDGEKRDLEETVGVLRKELNKTEQARKEASIKVRKRSVYTKPYF